MIYSTGTISINGNTATGSGTNWTAPASQVRAGQTIIVMSNPVQMLQISSVNSATSMTVTPAASPALSGQNYGILVSDNISVDGLALAMSQLIKEYDENIGAWETFATTSANQNITVTINGTSLSIPALGKLLQKGSNGALPVNQGGTGATNAADARTNLGLGDIKTKLTAAMQKAANGGDIQDVVAFRKSLQLGAAALRNVGMGGPSNLVDMDSIRGLMSGNGYIQIPCIATTGNNLKLYLQWGYTLTPPNSNNTYNVNVAFPNTILFAVGNRCANGSNDSMNVNAVGTQGLQIQNWAPGGSWEACAWIAIGY
ncbi:gp53-like domain-containing protein [Escherichia coli]|uniref:gp53-like domain-containing protein n=1 Tax=Escherichia coli TaxID=562 RepID=UPI0022E2E2E2|nr:hypothetical protein [Escherichia coli]